MAAQLVSGRARVFVVVLAALAVAGWLAALILAWSHATQERSHTRHLGELAASENRLRDELEQQRQAVAALTALFEKAAAARQYHEESTARTGSIETQTSSPDDLSRTAKAGDAQSERPAQTQAQPEGAEQRLDTTRHQITALEQAATIRVQELALVDRRLEEAQRLERQSRQHLTDLLQDTTAKSSELLRTEVRLRELREASVSARQRLEADHAFIAALSRQRLDLEQATAALTTKREQIAAAIDGLERHHDLLAAQASKLADRVAEKNIDLTAVTERLDVARAELASLEGRLKPRRPDRSTGTPPASPSTRIEPKRPMQGHRTQSGHSHRMQRFAAGGARGPVFKSDLKP